jgi:hypothetical protein
MSGGKDTGKRRSTREGAGFIDKLNYEELGTGRGKHLTMAGTTSTTNVV